MRGWWSGLAPRRRILVGALLALVLIVVAVVGAARFAGHHSTSVQGEKTPGPVVLVPGYGGGTGSLDRLAVRIRATGREAVVLSLPGGGTGDLTLQAKALQALVTRELTHADSVDVIGYSAGGVVVHLWLENFGGAAEARRIVTLGSPLHGADLAAVGQALVPGACPIACQQLVPGSSLLNGLNAQPIPAGIGWMSIWTTDDQTVNPPDSARLAGAVNVVAQDICPGVVISHGGLPTDPLVTGLVLSAITAAPIPTPTRADCTSLRS
jgi:triacylglycerol lipase